MILVYDTKAKKNGIINKLQPFAFFVLYMQIIVLILQHCLLILMLNGLRVMVGDNVKRFLWKSSVFYEKSIRVVGHFRLNRC